MPPTCIEQQLQGLPDQFPVEIIMQSQPGTANPWSGEQWQLVGVVAREPDKKHAQAVQLVREEGETRCYLYSGFAIKLYVDECESYYYNLMSPQPRCYVIARRNETGVPLPFLVSMSSDEANAHLECEDEVYSVDVAPELYRWTEAFVLMHYTAEKRRKRKRDNWKERDVTT